AFVHTAVKMVPPRVAFNGDLILVEHLQEFSLSGPRSEISRDCIRHSRGIGTPLLPLIAQASAIDRQHLVPCAGCSHVLCSNESRLRGMVPVGNQSLTLQLVLRI